MPQPGETTDVVQTLERAKKLIRTFLRQQDGRCQCCHQGNFTHAIDCEAHATFNEINLTIALERRARSRGPTQKLMSIVREAIVYQADKFNGPPHVPLKVSPSDVVEWFSEWRQRAHLAWAECVRHGGDSL